MSDTLDFSAIPIIRVEVDRLKSSIVHMLGMQGSILGERVAEQIDRAIADYPWQQQVEEAVSTAVTKAISQYFNYGRGWVAIKEAVEQGLEMAESIEEIKAGGSG